MQKIVLLLCLSVVLVCGDQFISVTDAPQENVQVIGDAGSETPLQIRWISSDAAIPFSSRKATRAQNPDRIVPKISKEITPETKIVGSGNGTIVTNSYYALMYVAEGNGNYVTVDFQNYGSIQTIYTSPFSTPTCVAINKDFGTIVLGNAAGYSEYNISFANGYLNPYYTKFPNFITTLPLNDMYPAGSTQIKSYFIAATQGLYIYAFNKNSPIVYADNLLVGIPMGVFYDGSEYVYSIGKLSSGQATLIEVEAYTSFYQGAWVWNIALTYEQLAYFPGNPTGITGNSGNLLWIATSSGIYQYNIASGNGFLLISGIAQPSGVRYYFSSLFFTEFSSGKVFEFTLGAQYVDQLNFYVTSPMGFYIGGSTMLTAGLGLVALLVSLVL